MTVFVFYLLKVLICSGVLFLYYHFFLRNKLFHQWNRFYLLFAVVVSLLLPLVQFDVFQKPGEQRRAIQFILIGQSADNYLEEFIVTNKQSIGAETWLMILYGFISVMLLLSIIYSVCKIFSIIRSHTIKVLHNIKFINTDVKGAPFSFLNYIFWNKEIPLQTETGQQIFQHELVHVQEKHTWDKLFMQVVIALFWCNPFFWLIRKELKYIHEFIADKKAVGDAGTEAFAAMILQSVYPQQFRSVTNHFFQTSIKRRIFMLTQLKNPKVAYVSRVIALPIVALLVLSFTLRTKEKTNDQPSFQFSMVSNTDTIPKKEKEIASVDVNTAKKQLTITYADGSSEMLTENEATARGLIHNGGFSNRKEVVVGKTQNSSIQLREIKNPPLFILDGEEVSKEKIETLDPKLIESVNVLKDASATAIYGTKGKNGVVEIKTKKQPTSDPITLQENGKEVMKGKISNVQVQSNAVAFEADEITVLGFKSKKAATDNNEPVFDKAEFTPSIDKDEWRAFLEKHMVPIIEYAANKNLPEGNYTCQVRFIVEKDGSLSNISVLNDPGYGIGNKVLEMMKFAPKWKPAIQHQKVVRSFHTQPITFQIQESESDVTLNNK
jgi:TonB-dependent SusC/RagA subfamily outer membrane receptor